MPKSVEVVMVPEDGYCPASQSDCTEDGVDVPLERINPDTLRNMIVEFVTREWGESSEADYTLDDKVVQVQQQLKSGKAKVVFDLTTETCNIVSADSMNK